MFPDRGCVRPAFDRGTRMSKTVTPKLYGTRAEHIAACKLRALEYCDRGDLANALSSMLSDLSEHDETRDHVGIKLAAIFLVNGINEPAIRRWIDGFN